MSSKISYVFIRNKLISCDSFLPIALELKEKLGLRTSFITFDKKTFKVINENIVIKDTINHVGVLLYPETRIQKALLLSKIIFQLIFYKTLLFHFGHLSSGIFKVLSRLNPKRTFFCEPDSSGFSKFMFEVDYARSGGTYSITKKAAPKSGYLLAFSDEWLWLTDPRVKELKTFILRHPRSWPSWRNYLTKISDTYINTSQLRPKVITCVLGFFGPTNITENENSMKACFIETLDIINRLPNTNELTILLKPHPVTSINELKDIINTYPKLDLRITYVHPSLLALHSDIAICNLYSTAIYDFSILGKVTIEYSDYCSQAIETSNGKSCRPEFIDYFINKKPDELTNVLNNLMSNLGKKNKLVATSDNEFVDFIRKI